MSDQSAQGPDATVEPDVPVELDDREGADEQIAFDINDFPGGARSALEAVLMVVDEPVTEVALASALELPVEDVRGGILVLDGQQAKLTQASLETLAVIAYRQPVSRARVSAVRGVNVDGVVRTLTSRGLIEEVEDLGESGAMLYRTTPYFLQRMGLSSLDDLPALAPYLPDADVIDELIEEGHA